MNEKENVCSQSISRLRTNFHVYYSSFPSYRKRRNKEKEKENLENFYTTQNGERIVVLVII
jgi:hypothetical protein